MKQPFFTIFVLAFVFAHPVHAAENDALAQSKPVQKAVLEVQTSVDGLVTARDENITNDFALRIDAFKKVVDLSLAEAKDLQVRALLIEKDPKELALWREKTLAKVEDAVRHFELLKKKGFAHLKDVQAVKSEAEDFRLWREVHYTPALQAVNDYSSLQKGREILLVAKERSQKITKDLAKLGKSGLKSADLQSRLTKANAIIAESEKQVASGEEIFRNTYILPLTVTSTELLALLTPTSSLVSLLTETPNQESAPATTSTTASAATSTSPAPAEVQAPLSIKDLVRSSFDGVKDAYQIFIEMSGLVRKSL